MNNFISFLLCFRVSRLSNEGNGAIIRKKYSAEDGEDQVVERLGINEMMSLNVCSVDWARMPDVRGHFFFVFIRVMDMEVLLIIC